MVFLKRCSLMDIFNGIYFHLISDSNDFFRNFENLYKQKQALLGSNLSGITQRFDKNIIQWIVYCHNPLIFLENPMPSKTHQ